MLHNVGLLRLPESCTIGRLQRVSGFIQKNPELQRPGIGLGLVPFLCATQADHRRHVVALSLLRSAQQTPSFDAMSRSENIGKGLWRETKLVSSVLGTTSSGYDNLSSVPRELSLIHI